MSPRVQLVLFDFDGTLVDTAPDLIRSVNIFLKLKGLDPLPEERIRSEIGLGLKRLILDLYPSENQDEAFQAQIEREFLAVYEQEFLRTPRLFDGVLNFLTEYDGQFAIVSNKRERFIKPIMQHLGIYSLPWVRIVGGDTYGQMKPHPEPFMRAIEAAGCTPEETLIVGDGEPDVVGALAVGARCVAVGFGYTPVDELMGLGAFASIESFHELLPLIRSLT